MANQVEIPQGSRLIGSETIHEAPHGAPDTKIETYKTPSGRIIEHIYSEPVGKRWYEPESGSHGDVLREL